LATGELQMRAELSQVMNDLTDADLVFEVTAKPNRSAVLESLTMQTVEDAVKASLLAFAESLETHVERVAVLEEVSKNCVTIWFRFHASDRRHAHALNSAVDPSLLKYAAQGVLTILNWMDGRSQPRLSDLHQAIRVLAWGTSATSCSRPAAPSSVNLVQAVAAWERVKDILRESASARLTMQQGSAELDLAKKIPELTTLLDKEVVNRAVEMILVVDRPDYGATGEWVLKHGQARFTVQCGASDLLERFYQRELDIRPGDALHCRVQFNTCYGPDHEVVDERLSVVEVLEVLPAPGTANDKAKRPDTQLVERNPEKELEHRMLVL
jgi:hypothetical protein